MRTVTGMRTPHVRPESRFEPLSPRFRTLITLHLASYLLDRRPKGSLQLLAADRLRAEKAER